MARSAHFSYKSCFAGFSARELYDWHARPGALERLIPPWEDTFVVSTDGKGLAPGATTILKVNADLWPLQWRAEHITNDPGVSFCDRQAKGPFASWQHSHLFSDSPSGGVLEDRVEYRLPLASLLPPFVGSRLQRRLQRIFSSRHATLAADLEVHRKYSSKRLKFLIAGASGVIGRALIPFLTTGGHEVQTLVRRKPEPDRNETFWDPAHGTIDTSALSDIDVIINLCGENIGQGRWKSDTKKKIISSRLLATQLLARTASEMSPRPMAMLSASAIGFYGNCGDRWVDERDTAGTEFISEVCKIWEQAAAPAAIQGIRTVLLRIGVVLTPRGGALKNLLVAARFGAARLGSGRQYLSWISIDDMVAALLHTAVTSSLHGPLNIASPEPVTNRDLMAAIAGPKKLPSPVAIPEAVLKARFGQMAQETILASCRVHNNKLLQSGFTFRHPHLASALPHLLGRKTI